jgi:Uma2 family endonuclease
MSAQATLLCTPDEYLSMERHAPSKSEYRAGEICAMPDDSQWHDLIVANVLREFRRQLTGRSCSTYASAMRVKVSLTGLYTYPDVTVVSGETQFEDDQEDTLLNPWLIVEVLSESTQGYDRGEKFEHYRKLASLREYVLIAQEECHVEHFVRQPDDRWLLSETDNIQDTIQLPSINCCLALAAIYDQVDIVVTRTPQSRPSSLVMSR